MLVMLEFQSSIDWFMALRVQGYAVRPYESLWQGWQQRRHDRLPMLLAVVAYNGKVGRTAAPALADLVGAEARPQTETGWPFAGESYVLVDVGAIARSGCLRTIWCRWWWQRRRLKCRAMPRNVLNGGSALARSMPG